MLRDRLILIVSYLKSPDFQFGLEKSIFSLLQLRKYSSHYDELTTESQPRKTDSQCLAQIHNRLRYLLSARRDF